MNRQPKVITFALQAITAGGKSFSRSRLQVRFVWCIFGYQVLRHLWLENAQLPRLAFRHRGRAFGVKIALKLHLLLALHLLKKHRSHTPVRAALVWGQGWLRLLTGSAGFTESQSDTDPIG